MQDQFREASVVSGDPAAYLAISYKPGKGALPWKWAENR